MIRQLGLLTFFVTFITNVNNWPIVSNMLKELYENMLLQIKQIIMLIIL